MSESDSVALAFADATKLAALIRSRQITASELLESTVTRITEFDPGINAVITRSFERARSECERLPTGPFTGVPILLKDLGNPSAGDPYYEGTHLLRDLQWVADRDGYVTSKLRAAGFVVCGRTNTAEWGTLPTTEPSAFGPTKNPWNLSLSAGGSSGGSAAAVAVGMVAVASGSDGGGSIRIPASLCGLVGLKVTRGRISVGPQVGEGWGGLLVPGVLTRSVRDTHAVLKALAGPMPGDPYGPSGSSVSAQHGPMTPSGRLHVGILTDVLDGETLVAEQCARAARNTAQQLENLGHHVEDSYPRALAEIENVRRHFGRMTSVWTAYNLQAWSRRIGRAIGPGDIEPHNLAIANQGLRRSAASYVESLEWLHTWGRRVAQWWSDGFDVLVTPTVPEPPFGLGEIASTPDSPLGGLSRARDIVSFTMPYNATGQPAVSLPLDWTADGLPLGTQLVAAHGMEHRLIDLAKELEEARPWAARVAEGAMLP